MPTTIVWDNSHSGNSVKNTPVRNRVAEVFSGCGEQSFHLQVNRTVATVQKDLIVSGHLQKVSDGLVKIVYLTIG